jgi:hypothetical protein
MNTNHVAVFGQPVARLFSQEPESKGSRAETGEKWKMGNNPRQMRPNLRTSDVWAMTEGAPIRLHRRMSNAQIKRRRYLSSPPNRRFLYLRNTTSARVVHCAEIGGIDMPKPMTFDDTTASSKWVCTGIVFSMLIGLSLIVFANWG